MLWSSASSASRTPEKVWLRSAGTSVRSFPLGVRVEAEGDPRLMDLFEGLLDRGLGRPLGRRGAGRTPRGRSRPWLKSCSARARSALAQVAGRLLAPQGRDPGLELRDLVVDVLDRPLELPALAPGLGQDAPDLGPRGLHVGLGVDHGRLLEVDLDLVRLPVELDQQVPLASPGRCRRPGPGSPGRRPGGPRRSRGR